MSDFKQKVADYIVGIINTQNTQKVQVELGYAIGIYNGIPYRINTTTLSKFEYTREEVMPMSEEYNQETPSVNGTDRSEYTVQYQIECRLQDFKKLQIALEEYREYMFQNKQTVIDGYTLAFKTMRGDKQGTIRDESGNYYVRYKINLYFMAIKNGYIKKDTDIVEIALSEDFGTPKPTDELVEGAFYEIVTLGNADWNQIFGTSDETYEVGDKGNVVQKIPSTGVAKLTYEQPIIMDDTATTDGAVSFSNSSGKSLGVITTTSFGNRLEIAFNNSYIENILYQRAMNKFIGNTKNTKFRIRSTFNGQEYEYTSVLIKSVSRRLQPNGLVILVVNWIEADE